LAIPALAATHHLCAPRTGKTKGAGVDWAGTVAYSVAFEPSQLAQKRRELGPR